MALVEQAPKPPTDLYDEDFCLLALRADRFTRGQARAAIARELGEDFTAIRVRKTAYRYPHEYVQEMAEDGVREPYDGWPWWECGPGEDGTLYWKRLDAR